jgi:hypothetical protein
VAGERKIDAKDLKLFRVTDDPAEATRLVIEARNRGVPQMNADERR